MNIKKRNEKIFAAWLQGAGKLTLATQFGVSETTVHRAVDGLLRCKFNNGKDWRYSKEKNEALGLLLDARELRKQANRMEAKAWRRASS